MSSDGTFNWAYSYPGQYHIESKSHTGEVLGSHGHIDSNGKGSFILII